MDVSFDHLSLIREMIISVVIAGLVGGTALVFLWERWLRKMSFMRALGYIFLWYAGVYVLVNFVATIIGLYFASSESTTNPLFEVTLAALLNRNALLNSVFWMFVVYFTMGVLLIRDKFGPKAFLSFLMGKYFRPKREHRIFMFMDLKSSTSIAEKLGELKYFEFLNDTFKTAIPGIMDTLGEIYQYVGDEIVISWNLRKGLKSANCLRCYFEMIDRLEDRKEYFKSTYDVMPQFKAGLHSGFAIVGEMGVIKRELVYSGDVLNTTARIQSKCNELEVNILISKTLREQINNNDIKVQPKNMGEFLLKGKTEKVEVFTL